MVKRSVEQWQELFRQHDESGLSASQFCRENELCHRYFSKRKKDLGWLADKKYLQTTPSKLRSFVKVKPTNQAVTQPSDSIKVQVHNVCITVPAAQSSIWVADLVKALNA